MSKPNLLALDDEQDNLDLIARALRSDYEVTVQTSGVDALKLFEDHDYNVILSDQRMPQMTGVDFLQESLKRQPSSIRILITGYSDIESVIDAVNKGAIHRYIKKPWKKDELVREIKETIERQGLILENQQMIKALKEANEKLEAQHQLLQKSLDERSKELFAMNQKLLELNEILRGQSMSDGLTGLNNHISFQQRLKEEVSRAVRKKGSVSLIFIDVDHFKKYNDSNGHQAGDELLKKIAELLSKTSRSENAKLRNSDIVARYGGEEFAAILPDTPFEGAKIKAERIRKSIDQYVFPGMEKQPGGKITVSIGVATYPDDALTPEKLIEYADTAMYKAKNSGRNQVIAYRDIKKTDL